jgi:hypothetical protein
VPRLTQKKLASSPTNVRKRPTVVDSSNMSRGPR